MLARSILLGGLQPPLRPLLMHGSAVVHSALLPAGCAVLTTCCDCSPGLVMQIAQQREYYRNIAALCAVCAPQVDAHPLSQMVQAAPTDAVPTWAWTIPTGGASASSSATASGQAASSAHLMRERVACACLLLCSMLGIHGACMLLTLLRLHETAVAADACELCRLGERSAGC